MEKRKYKVVRGVYGRNQGGNRTILTTGSEFFPSEIEIKVLGGNIAPVDTPAALDEVPLEEDTTTTEAGEEEDTTTEAGEEEEWPDGASYIPLKGGWYKLRNGEKVQGVGKLQEALEAMEREGGNDDG